MLTIASRLPLASVYLFSWDAANFALALDRFSPPEHRPQPPGYPLYVAAGWLVRLVVGDANAAFVALSMAASAGAVVLLAGLAWRLLGARVALGAAALFLTSPNLWGNGLVAYPYAFLALAATATAWTTVETRWGQRNLAPAGALLLGLGAGFRPDALPLLGGVWLYGAWARGWRTVAAGSALLLLTVLAWLIPLVQRSGGWDTYRQASAVYAAYWSVPVESVPAFVQGVRGNVETLLKDLAQTTGPILGLLLVFGVGRLLSLPVLRARPPLRLLPLWVAPPLAFYALVHIGNLGYLLSVLPALALLGASAAETLAVDLASRLQRIGSSFAFASVVGLASAANVALFVFLSGPMSLREVRDVDRELAGNLALIRSLPADSTLVVSFDRYRQFAYYLPSRRRAGRVISGLDLLGGPSSRRVTLTPPPGVTRVVLPDLYENRSDRAEEVVPVRSAPGVTAYVARLDPGERLRLGLRYARVLPGQPRP